jgi:hypothetical protein
MEFAEIIAAGSVPLKLNENPIYNGEDAEDISNFHIYCYVYHMGNLNLPIDSQVFSDAAFVSDFIFGIH